VILLLFALLAAAAALFYLWARSVRRRVSRVKMHPASERGLMRMSAYDRVPAAPEADRVEIHTLLMDRDSAVLHWTAEQGRMRAASTDVTHSERKKLLN